MITFLPHQVHPGRVNNHPKVFDWKLSNGKEILAFGSSKFIFIYHEDKVFQILDGHENEVNLVNWCRGPPSLLGCSENRIVIYQKVDIEDINIDEFAKNKAPEFWFHDIEEEVSKKKVKSLVNKNTPLFHASPKNGYMWKSKYTINMNFGVIACASWNLYGTRILVGGKSGLLYFERNKDSEKRSEISWQETWKFDKNVSKITDCDFSPDGRLFFTVSEFSRYLKIWFSQTFQNDDEDKQAIDFSFIYLSHDRGIKMVKWKQRSFSKNDEHEKISFSKNILFTLSVDNVIRIWSETNEDETFNFYISAIIDDPNKNIWNVNWLSRMNDLTYDSETHVAKIESTFKSKYDKLKSVRKNLEGHGHFDKFFEFQSDLNVISTSPETTVDAADDESSLKISLKEKLQKVKEPNSFLMIIHEDGSIDIKDIQGLYQSPRRTPRINTRFILPNLFQPLLSTTTEKKINISKQISFCEFNVKYHNNPSLVTIYNHDIGKGSLTRVEIDLEKTPKTNVELTHTYSGHLKEELKTFEICMTNHPNLPLLASSEGNKVNFWTFSDNSFYPFNILLTNLSNLNTCIDFGSKISTIAWYPSSLDSILFYTNERGLSVVRVESKDSHDRLNFKPSSYSMIGVDDIQFDKMEVFQNADMMSFLDLPPKTSGNQFESLLAVLSEDRKSFATWKVSQVINKEKREPLKTNLVLFHSFENFQIVSLDYMTSYVSETEIIYLVTTICSDCFVRVFTLRKAKEKKVKRKPMGLLARLKLEKQQKESQSSADVKYELFEWSKFKLCCRTDLEISHYKVSMCQNNTRMFIFQKNSNSLQVYECESSNSFILEKNIVLEDTVLISCIQSFTVENGKSNLLLGTNNGIMLYTQRNVKDQSSYWMHLANLEIQTPSPVNSMVITERNSLIASCGDMIYVFTKWMKQTQVDDTVTVKTDKYSELTLTEILEQFNKRLPDYHPSVLNDLLLKGRFDLVKRTFKNLANNLKKMYGDSISVPQTTKKLIIPNQNIDYLFNVHEDPKSLKVKKGSGPTSLFQKYKFLRTSVVPEMPTEIISPNSPISPSSSIKKSKFPATYKILKEKLNEIEFSELSRIDQMKLMSILETVNSIKTTPDALDEYSVRYLLQYSINTFFSKSISHVHGGSSNLSHAKIKSCYNNWVLHSETQETLINDFILKDSSANTSNSTGSEEKISFEFMKNSGLIYWLKDQIFFKKIVVKLGKNLFIRNKNDPKGACALIYLALRKKSTLIQLFRATGNKRLVSFFGRDFSIEKNQVAASKNGMKLLGRREFLYSCAFFLLGERFDDVLDVIIQRLKDVHLAFLITRVYYGLDHPQTTKVLKTLVLNYAKRKGDCWLISTCYWLMKDYQNFFKSIISCHLTPNSNEFCGDLALDTKKNLYYYFDQSIFDYLNVAFKILMNNENLRNLFRLKDQRDLLHKISYFLEKSGSSLLSVEYLKKIGSLTEQNDAKGAFERKRKIQYNSQVESGLIDFSSFGFGMAAPVVNVVKKPSIHPSFSQVEIKSKPDKKDDVPIKNDEFEKFILREKCLKISVRILSQFLVEEIRIYLFSTFRKKESKNLKCENGIQITFSEKFEHINEFIDKISKRYEILEFLLRKKLKRFCKLKSSLLGRFWLIQCESSENTVKKRIQILDNFCYDMINSLFGSTSFIKTPFSVPEINKFENIVEEFLVCFKIIEKDIKDKGVIKQKFCSTFFVILLLISWSKRDSLSMLVLFSLNKIKFESQEDKSSGEISFIDNLHSDLLQFYEDFKNFSKIEKEKVENEKERRRIEQEDRENARRNWDNLAYLTKINEDEPKNEEVSKPDSSDENEELNDEERSQISQDRVSIEDEQENIGKKMEPFLEMLKSTFQSLGVDFEEFLGLKQPPIIE